MHVPSAEELAAIALAYVAVAHGKTPAPVQTARASRWALAGRLPVEHDTARIVAARGNRWAIAARLSG